MALVGYVSSSTTNGGHMNNEPRSNYSNYYGVDETIGSGVMTSKVMLSH